jgi:hypothetical protein
VSENSHFPVLFRKPKSPKTTATKGRKKDVFMHIEKEGKKLKISFL